MNKNIIVYVTATAIILIAELITTILAITGLCHYAIMFTIVACTLLLAHRLLNDKAS